MKEQSNNLQVQAPTGEGAVKQPTGAAPPGEGAVKQPTGAGAIW